MPVDARPLAIAVMGPTASGKTAFAVELARQYGGEIVSVDSALVYRGLDIGESRRLFPLGEEIYMLPREYYTPFDVTADGQRFIMARAVESDDGGEAPLYMTLNWFRELDGR